MKARETAKAAEPVYQRRAWAWAGATTVIASSLLIASYFLPTVRFKSLGSSEEVYTIWGGIVSLWQHDNYVLAPIVFLFSMVFPIAKLAVLAWAWSVRRDLGRGRRTLATLQHLGKWSMLDVLIIALFVGSIRIGIANATSKPGIVLFALAVAVSMIAARLAARARLDGTVLPGASDSRRTRAAMPWLHRATALLAAGALAGFLAQPLFRITRGFIFSNEVGLVSTSRAMVSEGEPALGTTLLAVAAILPVLRCLLSVWIAFLPSPSRRTHGIAGFLEEWAMADVFALALVIAQTKLAALTTATILPGFGWALAAGALTIADGAVLRSRRALRR